LLEYVVSQEESFRPATVVVGPAGTSAAVNEPIRRAKTLDDLGPHRKRFEEKLREVLSHVLTRLKITPFPLGQVELQVTASSDGDYFRMHRDGGNDSTRELSFVYYFHREPRRFSGGELRLFDAKLIDGKYVPTDQSQTLSPRQDVIVFFPSHDEHEVLPVRVPTKAFADGRFTVNGWIHRAK
jgi:Rps23 Pro-64 3,4-dihydroxylase Tpa1-like proline 4-hydroxylase